jgi:hypothetical protein
MNRKTVSRRRTLQGMGAATACGLLPAKAQEAAVPAAQALARARKITLDNGVIAATLYPPGDNAFYRGTRFDHAGVIGSLTMNGREFYGPWFDAIQDDVPDYRWVDGKVVTGRASSTMGPAEEFDPVGFDQAAPGGIFLLPGVGLLTRPDSQPYNHFRSYQRPANMLDARFIKTSGSSAEMRHVIAGAGYSYGYTKTVTLTPGRPELVISHLLRNDGELRITTSVYNHNFVILNPGNAAMKVTLPFAPAPLAPATRLQANGNTVTWPQALEERQSGYAILSETRQPYDFTVTDTSSGASVHARCSRDASQYKLWSIKTVMAVEPYVALNVAPGAEQRWTYTYTYGVS